MGKKRVFWQTEHTLAVRTLLRGGFTQTQTGTPGRWTDQAGVLAGAGGHFSL